MAVEIASHAQYEQSLDLGPTSYNQHGILLHTTCLLLHQNISHRRDSLMSPLELAELAACHAAENILNKRFNEVGIAMRMRRNLAWPRKSPTTTYPQSSTQQQGPSQYRAREAQKNPRAHDFGIVNHQYRAQQREEGPAARVHDFGWAKGEHASLGTEPSRLDLEDRVCILSRRIERPSQLSSKASAVWGKGESGINSQFLRGC